MIYLYSGNSLFNSRDPTPDECIGPLPDTLTCETERDVKALFDLSLTYPANGYNGGKIAEGMWISAPAGKQMGRQYFCIDSVEEYIGNTLAVHASHISYNSDYIIAAPFTTSDPNINSPLENDSAKFYPWSQKLLAGIQTIDETQLGNFALVGFTDDMEINAANYTAPVSLRQAVLDAAEDRDIFITSTGINLRLWQAADVFAPDFIIRYGKNLIKYTSTTDSGDFYTHIFPYAYTNEDVYSTYHNQIFQLRNVPEELKDIKRIKAVDLTGMYGLDAIEGLPLDIFEICIDMWLARHPFADFTRQISLETIPEQENTYELGAVGDIYFGGKRIRTTIVSLRYDVLKDKVTDIGVGRLRRDVTDTIAKLTKGK